MTTVPRPTGSGEILPAGQASPFDAIRRVDERGEHWMARELMALMQYSRWEDFAAVTDKARVSLALVQGEAEAASQFGIIRITSGRWAGKATDYRLTRFASYLTAMAGDDTKEAVAEARIYFAVRTREAETAPARYALPRSFAEALELAARQAREIESQTAELAAITPAAEAWDVLASAEGDWSVREAAHILNRDPAIEIGQNRLFVLLRGLGLIDRNDRPYQSHANHVRLRPVTYLDGADVERTAQQVRITAAGLKYLHQRLGGTRQLRLLVSRESAA